MKTKTRNLCVILMAFVLFLGVAFGLAFGRMTWATPAADATYGWTSNNESGTIAQKENGIWLSAKAATTGDIFDYTYDTAITPADVDVMYTVVSDTTRGAGTHSRLNFYILPTATSAVSEGVKIQMIQSALDSESQFVVTGPDGGWDAFANFNADYSVNMRLYQEGTNWFLNVNGSRYQFSGENVNRLNAMQATGKAYLRTTAHFQENGESAFGSDVCIHSIDDVSFGTPTAVNSTFVSTKVQASAEASANVTEKGLEISGKFAAGLDMAARYSLGEGYRLTAGELDGYSMTMDVSRIDKSVKKYLEISFTNILANADRMDAWDSVGDAANQPTINAMTYRLYLITDSVIAITKYHDGNGVGTFEIKGGQNNLDNAPHYEFSSFIPRTDNVMTFQVMKWNGAWKVLVNGAAVGYMDASNGLMDELNGTNCEVSVKLGSDDAANYYANNGINVPLDTLVITGVNGTAIYYKEVTEEPEISDSTSDVTSEPDSSSEPEEEPTPERPTTPADPDKQEWLLLNDSSKVTQLADGLRVTAKEATTGNIFDMVWQDSFAPADFETKLTVESDTTRDQGSHSRLNLYILPEKDSDLSEGVQIQLINAKVGNAYGAYIAGVGDMTTVYYNADYSMTVRIRNEGSTWLGEFNGSRISFGAEQAAKLASMNFAYLRVFAHFQENGEEALGMDVKFSYINEVVLGEKVELDTLFASSKNNGAAKCAATIANGMLSISGQFNEGLIDIGKYGFGNAFGVDAGKLGGYNMVMDYSGVDTVPEKYVEISFTNILNNGDRMDAWDSMGDAEGQPTILAISFRIYFSAQKKVLAIVKDSDGTTGSFGVLEPTTNVENAPHYLFDSFMLRNNGLLTFSLENWQDTWKLLVNGQGVGQFPAQLSELLNKLNESEVGVSIKIGSDAATTYYRDNGQQAPTDTLVVKGINGQLIGEVVDKNEGVYADELTGELEFTRNDFVYLTPPDSTITNYEVTDEGLSILGRNETLGFSAGLGYMQALDITHESEFTFTVLMPEDVFSYNMEKHGYYCFFIGNATHCNFSEMKSLYLRVSYESPDVLVKSATTPFKLEVIMWDNEESALVMASNTLTVQPKTTAGHESEITFRILYDAESACYRLYVNGQRATTPGLEEVITDYFDNKMNKKYWACTFDYSLNGAAGGAWAEGEPENIGATLVSFNGEKIVNKIPDIFAGMTLSDATDITETSAVLHWTKGEYVKGDFDAANFTPTGYKLIRGVATLVDGKAEVTVDAEIYIDDINILEYADTNLEKGATYYYTLYAVQKNADGTYTELFVSNRNKRVQLLKEEDVSSDSDSVTSDSIEESVSGSESAAPASCFGSISAAGIAVVVSLAAVTVVLKKKED